MSQRCMRGAGARAALAAVTLAVAVGWAGTPALGSDPVDEGLGPQRVPRAGYDPAAGREVVPIPKDWRTRYPFSARFAPADAEGAGAHVVDLKAIRFVTDALRSRDERGRVLFLDPDLSSFPGGLIRQPFAGGPLDHFILQAGSPQDQLALRAKLEEAGLPILDYIPSGAYLVRLSPVQWASVQRLPEVFWAGPLQPSFRVNPKLDYVIEASPEHVLMLEATFDGMAYADVGALLQAGALRAADIRDVTPTAVGWRVRVQAAAVYARDLAATPGCLWVERYVRPELDNNVARTSANTPTGHGAQNGPIMDVEDVWARGIRGEGQIASAADTGLSTGSLSTLHYDFGQQASGSNPMRVLKGYALGRAVWDDDMNTGGGHGTHTSGSIVGNGVRSGATPSSNVFPSTCYAGTAPKAQFVFQSVLDSQGGLGGIPSDLTTLFQPPYNDGARVHSNSWGASAAGDYTTRSQDLDRFTWLNPDMVITFSAGNSGRDGKYSSGSSCYTASDPLDGVIDDDSMGAPATAKNCITVGAAENYRPDFVYEYPQADCTGDGFSQQAWGWFNGCTFSLSPIYADLMANNAAGLAAFSSRGPTNDGRFKPDIVAPGVGIISTRSDKNQAYEQWGTCNVPAPYQPYYMTQGGTSMANPLTAGTAVLVRQYYQDGWHPNHSQVTNTTPSSGQGFNPSAALVKATLINGAWDMAPGQYGTGTTQEMPPNWDTGHDLPNNAEGYGRVDLEHSLFPGSGWGDVAQRMLEVHDVAPGLQTGQHGDYSASVTSGANPLIVTLVWTDPYGALSAGTELVNDLDLTVTSPTGTVYYPNGLNKTSGADHTNNVEQVKVTSPGTGNWTVRVNGASVPGNGVGGTTTQPYALVISGVISPPCATIPGAPQGLAATAPAAGQIALAWSSGSPAGTSYNVYRASGTCPGAGFTQVAAGLTATAYSDTGLPAGRTYAYTVTARLEGCESAPSGCASAKVSGSCNGAPTFSGLTSVSVVAGNSCALALAWSAGTATCDGPVTYSVYRSTSSSFTPSSSNRLAFGVLGTSYTDSSRLAAGTTYYYIVRAVDESNLAADGNTVTRNAALPGGGGGTQTLFSSDFETGSGLAGWGLASFDAGSTTTDWQGIQACAAHGGTHVFRFGDASCAGTYENDDFIGAIPGGSSGITFPSGAAAARLSFWHRWDFETGYDGATLAISDDDQNFYVVSSSAILGGPYNGSLSYYCPPGGAGGAPVWTGTQGAFQNTVVDLDAAYNLAYSATGGVAGRTIYIAFTAITDCSTTGTGWFLDDVAVTYGGSSSPCATCPSLAVTAVNTACPTVQVSVLATDASGNPLAGLTTSNFDASEDGTAQTLTSADLGAGNYRLTYATSKQDGQYHALDLALTSGGCEVHTAASARCAAACSVTCSATVPATGQPGQPVSFAAVASPSNCSGSPTYVWTFGDGATSTSQNPSHTYASGGSYNWSLTVSVDGKSCTQSGAISVLNPPVVASIKKVTPPFTIVATGSNFQPGIKVYINGVEWTGVLYKTSAKVKLTGAKALKAVVPKGVTTTFRFRNPDGGEATTTWGY